MAHIRLKPIQIWVGQGVNARFSGKWVNLFRSDPNLTHSTSLSPALSSHALNLGLGFRIGFEATGLTLSGGYAEGRRSRRTLTVRQRRCRRQRAL